MYDLNVASWYPKKIGGKTYWYLREMARVDGKPRMVSERYVGSAAEVAALLDARERAVMPDRTRHLGFGDVAAAWGVLAELGVAGIVDEVVGPGPAGLPLTAGTYLALAALNRLVAPCSKAAFADWWKSTAADRFTKIGARALDHRRFWDAMHAVTAQQLERIGQTIALRLIEVSGVDVSSVALDMTNFATFITTANAKAPIAQRGKAKQKRSDLRLVGLGLVVTRDGGNPVDLACLPRRQAGRHPVPGDDRPAPPAIRGDHRRGRAHQRQRGDDGGLRRRAEQRRQLRPPGRQWPALHRVGADQRLPGPGVARHSG